MRRKIRSEWSFLSRATATEEESEKKRNENENSKCFSTHFSSTASKI